ncbi:hypothetical protein [uncultured Croceicoccus sp.]|uniref:hypothetical protein n=1 Tax=uncultured Croceicoccus sp. TaxID=1295329 RepID=UPI0026395880|nr:hypothetical protein [uncultured Croceicoccus sp.]
METLWQEPVNTTLFDSAKSPYDLSRTIGFTGTPDMALEALSRDHAKGLRRPHKPGKNSPSYPRIGLLMPLRAQLRQRFSRHGPVQQLKGSDVRRRIRLERA